MKSYNIAVCLSGEPRTWKHTASSIKHFFSSERHTYKFFGHTWNTNFYNKEWSAAQRSKSNSHDQMHTQLDEHLYNETYNVEQLRTDIKDVFGMTELIVEEKSVVPSTPNLLNPMLNARFNREYSANLKTPTTWAHMCYSIMKANALKTQYELVNEMQFDVVVRARYDICYPPDSKFDQLLEYHGSILPTAVYGETHYFPNEYFLPHFNDVFYFGNSRVMNVVDGFYRYFGTGKFWEMLDENWNDCALKSCGYNVHLYKWLTLKNILMRSKIQSHAVFRKTAENLKWPDDWHEIVQSNLELFK